jgi:hypothetical protein
VFLFISSFQELVSADARVTMTRWEWIVELARTRRCLADPGLSIADAAAPGQHSASARRATARSTASSRKTNSVSTWCASRPNSVHPSAFILQPFPAVLIDGETLSDLMIDYNIGVSVAEGKRGCQVAQY